jgi:osomolarity two-component system sensor histidine kinase NIK1
LDNSISSEVTTPVRIQDLASALISALESSTVSPAAATNDVVFDILLAEDNLVNQKLAVKILEKYGHTVEIAENGSLAVDASIFPGLQQTSHGLCSISVLTS